MGREVKPKPSCVVVITRGLPSANFWIARCKTCGWSSQPSRYVSEVRADAYEHEHPEHRLPIDLLATAYEVEQRNLSSGDTRGD